MRQRREMIFFLYAERATGDVDMIGGQQIDRVVLSALLESSLDSEDFAQSGDLLRLCDAADRADASADEIDDALGDQREVFRGTRKYFANRLRRGTRLAHFL